MIHPEATVAEESGAVAMMVRRTAESLAIPFVSAPLKLGAGAGETEARRARMGALEAMRQTAGAGVIMLGHHADDQAETVLMRLLRGSGPAGLAAMGARDGVLARPLLPFRRSELARYVHVRGLESWEDPANRDSRHLRSWLRTAVFPIVERRLPDVVERLTGLGPEEALKLSLRDMEAAGRLAGALDAPMKAMRQAKEAAHLIIAAADLAGLWTLDDVVERLR